MFTGDCPNLVPKIERLHLKKRIHFDPWIQDIFNLLSLSHNCLNYKIMLKISEKKQSLFKFINKKCLTLKIHIFFFELDENLIYYTHSNNCQNLNYTVKNKLLIQFEKILIYNWIMILFLSQFELYFEQFFEIKHVVAFKNNFIDNRTKLKFLYDLLPESIFEDKCERRTFCCISLMKLNVNPENVSNYPIQINSMIFVYFWLTKDLTKD